MSPDFLRSLLGTDVPVTVTYASGDSASADADPVTVAHPADNDSAHNHDGSSRPRRGCGRGG